MLLADKIKEYSAKIIEQKATNQEFTSTFLVEKVNVKHTNRKTVENVFQEHRTSRVKAGLKSYALFVKQLYNSLKEFSHSLDSGKGYCNHYKNGGSESYGTDLRNRASHELCKRIVESGVLDDTHLPFI